MLCPQCQSPVEPSTSNEGQAVCKSCGATLSSQVGRPAAPPTRQARSWLSTILFSTVLLVLATIAVASTFVAKRTLDERDRAREDLLRATEAIENTVAAAATSTALKGSAAEAARQQILEPALAYYQKYADAHVGDKKATAQIAAVYLHMAAIQAKLRSRDAAASLGSSVEFIRQLAKEPNTDPADFPSVQACILKPVAPSDWIAVKGIPASEMQMYAIGFFINLQGLMDVSEELSRQHAEVVGFRDDLAGLKKLSATLQTMVPGRNKEALTAWLEARDLMETLVRDRPADAEYKARLAESLVAAARLQKSAQQLDEAATNYKRAVELREQLAAANPDDATLQKELANVKRELDNLKPAQASSEAPAPATPQ